MVTEISVTVVAVVRDVVVTVKVVAVIAVAVVVVVVVTTWHTPFVQAQEPGPTHSVLHDCPSLMACLTQPNRGSHAEAVHSPPGSSEAHSRAVPGRHTARPRMITQEAVLGNSHAEVVQLCSAHGSNTVVVVSVVVTAGCGSVTPSR